MSNTAPTGSDTWTPAPLRPVAEQVRPTAPLPAPLTGFIERPREVAALGDLLHQDGVRLVTLTGPGGVGKTRLALRVAMALAPSFADGVAFVGLTATTDPGLVPETIALALGAREGGERPEGGGLIEVLRDRHLLLVLDTFEHVLPAASLITDLLTACPGLIVLVTSRRTLRLSGEQVFSVPPLTLPEQPVAPLTVDAAMQSEAVALFAARAQAASRGFALTAGNLDAVIAICRRLDGLPLAIELAAARVGGLPPPTLLGRLERRLPLLADGPRDVPDRHQTMRGAIAWSHELLSGVSQTLFRRLAVFEDGCTLTAAEVVAGEGVDVVDALSALVAGSLVQCWSGPGDEPRYQMLETIREFALEQLVASGEEAAIRDAHAAWCLAMAAEAGAAGIEVLDQGGSDRLSVERDNLRAALGWLTRAGGSANGVRLIGLLGPFWSRTGLWTEGRGWLERALVWSAGMRTRERMAILIGAVDIRDVQSQGSDQRVVAWGEESLAIARELGDRDGEIEALMGLAHSAMCHGDTDRAKALYEELLVMARTSPETEVGRGKRESEALGGLGFVALYQDDDATAERLTTAALLVDRQAGRSSWVAGRCLILAVLAYRRGDRDRAMTHCREGLGIERDLREPWKSLLLLDRLAILAGEITGQAERAAQLGGAVESLHAVLGTTPNADEQPDRDRARLAARGHLGAGAFAAAWATGRSLRLEEALAIALQVASSSSSAATESGAARWGISPREVEVLCLLAEGRTDREIADALFLSRRTINTHVSHLLAKLGVNSRRQAIAVAHDEHLLTGCPALRIPPSP